MNNLLNLLKSGFITLTIIITILFSISCSEDDDNGVTNPPVTYPGWTTYTTANSGLKNNQISAIAIHPKDKSKWIGTYGGGVSRFDGKNWTTWTTAEGLGGNAVTSILIDRHDNVWVGTYSYHNGLSKYDGKGWTVWDIQLVNCIAIDSDDTLWIGTSRGVEKFKDRSLDFWPKDNDPNSWPRHCNICNGSPYDTVYLDTFVNAIAVENDSIIWIGTGTYGSGGVGKYNRNTNKWTAYKYIDEYFLDGTHGRSTLIQIMCIAMDSTGKKWFGGASGNDMFDDKKWYSFPSPTYSGGTSSIIIERNKFIWVGTGASGVVKYMKDGSFIKNYPAGSGLADPHIWSMAIEDSVNRWFGTYQGLSHYIEQK